MEHPFIDPKNFENKTIEEMEKSISELYNKVRFVQSRGDAGMLQQLWMMIESHKAILDAKINEKYGKDKDGGYETQIDISK